MCVQITQTQLTLNDNNNNNNKYDFIPEEGGEDGVRSGGWSRNTTVVEDVYFYFP